jgi:hypothetical protein
VSNCTVCPAEIPTGSSTCANGHEQAFAAVTTAVAEPVVDSATVGAPLDAEIVAAPPQGPFRIWPPVIAGLVVAIAGGLVWGAISVVTRFEIGFVATLIGVMSARAVVWASGGRRTVPLQYAAVIVAMFGILVGKYVIFMHALKEVAKDADPVLAANIPWVSSDTIALFFQKITVVVSAFDALWVVLAAMAAWRVVRDGHLPQRRGFSRA